MASNFTMKVDTSKMQEVIAMLPNKEKDLLAAIATEMVGDMKVGMLDSPADGNVYGDHVASSPGNPPRPDTGELLNSITHTATGPLEETIHDQVEYGKYLEFGTEHIEARPWMKPVFEKWNRGKYANFASRFRLVE